MKVGFTGTQKGMTERQFDIFAAVISELQPEEFHHGDCIGADEQAHDIVHVVAPDCKIVVHPPRIFRQRRLV